MEYFVGSTSVSFDVTFVDDSGLPLTGKVAADFPSLIYSVAGANADVAFPALTDLASLTTAWVAGGVKERGNGVYRVDAPNAMFATVGTKVKLRGEATGKHVLFPLIDVIANTTTGTGANTITITVNDGTNPIQNANVRVTAGAQTYLGTTNTSGQVVFNLDAATWTVAITAFGYTFAGASLVVTTTASQTYSMSTASITPSGAGFTTGYLTCYDQNGNPESGVQIMVSVATAGGVLGNAFDNVVVTETSGVNGVCQFPNLALGAAYRFQRGATGNPYVFTIPLAAGATYQLPSIIGSP